MLMESVLKVIQDTFKMAAEGNIKLLYFISGTYVVGAVLIFLSLVSGTTAPYGRYSRNGYGRHINGKIAWFVQELPSFVVPVIVMATHDIRQLGLPNILFISLFTIHYFQRACIFPFLIKGGKQTPMFPFVMALLFCLVNGYLQSSYLLRHADYGTDWWTRPHLLLGITLFVTGMAINIHSDHVLRNLRRQGETGYKIPKGGMFDLVSGANFFGEILEWAGFAIATWCIPALAFSFFTCCNIGPRAYQHHQYYLQKFENYPKNRKALIPFLL